MLISNNVSISFVLTFDLKFEDSSQDHTLSCKVGDKVKVKFKYKEEVIETVAVIKSIEAKDPIESITRNFSDKYTKETNPSILLDASSNFDSKVYYIYARDILDISFYEEDKPIE